MGTHMHGQWGTCAAWKRQKMGNRPTVYQNKLPYKTVVTIHRTMLDFKCGNYK